MNAKPGMHLKASRRTTLKKDQTSYFIYLIDNDSISACERLTGQDIFSCVVTVLNILL